MNSTSTEALAEALETRTKHLEELGRVREAHQRELDAAESSRLDALFVASSQSISQLSEALNIRATTLSDALNSRAETLRSHMESVNKETEMRIMNFTTDINKRLSAVELAMSEGKGKLAVDPYASDMNKRLGAVEIALSEGRGKQQVTDPQMDRLVRLVEELGSAQSRGTGTKEGISSSWGVLLGVVSLIATLITIFVFLSK
jgi:hypothetical protein